MRKITITIIILFGLFSICLCSCGPSYKYQVPERTHDGWQTGGLEEVGIDEKRIRMALDRIYDGDFDHIHSLLIVKDGKLVFEEYFRGYTFDYSGDNFQGEYTEYDLKTPHNLASVTKAYTSALVGIAIDQGYIQDVDQKVVDFFPDYAHLMEDAKSDITLVHLLSMTSGLENNQGEIPITDEENDIIQLHIVADPIEYILNKPLVAKPGTRWYYSEADVNLLGEIIHRVTGQSLDDFAQQHIFTPLGITQSEWKLLNPDFVWASGDLKLKPRDMAKLGYLYLNSGVWNGERILSEGWINESITPYIAVSKPFMAENWGNRYGYHWWLRDYQTGSTTVEVIIRTGWGGQAIIIFPSLDMVVVFTGGNYAHENYMSILTEIVAQYILPAVE